MIEISHLLEVADAYKAALSLRDETVSSRVFGDSKKLTHLRGNADITLGRFNGAMQWFSANWPETAVWPKSVARPVSSEAAA